MNYLLRHRMEFVAGILKRPVVVIALTVAIFMLFNSCHSGRRIPAEKAYSGLDFMRLLRSRADSQVRLSNGPGFSFHRIGDQNLASDEHGLEIVWLEFPLQVKLSVQQVSADDSQDGLYARLSDNRDLALLNGGYWEQREEETKDHKKEYVRYPVGLVRSNGQEISAFRRGIGGGVVFQAGAKFEILPTDGFEATDTNPTEAVQCKPLLINQGRMAMKSDDHRRDDRLAIGVDVNGSLIVAMATQPQGALTLYEFAEFLLVPRETGGPGCVKALNLDGSPGAHLYVPALSLHLGSHESGYVNNIIRIRH